MQFVKRRGSTNKKILVHDFEAIKTQFLTDVTAVVQMEDIPSKLGSYRSQYCAGVIMDYGLKGSTAGRNCNNE